LYFSRSNGFFPGNLLLAELAPKLLDDLLAALRTFQSLTKNFVLALLLVALPLFKHTLRSWCRIALLVLHQSCRRRVFSVTTFSSLYRSPLALVALASAWPRSTSVVCRLPKLHVFVGFVLHIFLFFFLLWLLVFLLLPVVFRFRSVSAEVHVVESSVVFSRKLT
jgi:hypothetical protein